MREWLESEAERLHNRAEALLADFYKAVLDADAYAHYAPRVERRRWTVTLQWRRIRYVNSKPMHEAMSRGQAFRYATGRFPKATEWERQAIEAFEDGAEYIRKQGDALVRIAQILDKYEQREKADVGEKVNS